MTFLFENLYKLNFDFTLKIIYWVIYFIYPSNIIIQIIQIFFKENNVNA